MPDPFSGHAINMGDPAPHVGLVTPDDGADLPEFPRFLLIGTAGDIKVTSLGGETVVIPAVPAGWFPCRVVRVWATGTTAADMSYYW